MTDIYYPSSLPPAITSGYELNDLPGVARDDMDNGFADQRLLDETPRTEHPITYKFTRNQLLLFEAWLRWKVGYVGWFFHDLEGGMGLQSHECRYKADALPRCTRQQGGFYFVQATIETRDRPMLNEAEFDVLVDEDIAVLITGFGSIHDALMALGS